MLRFIEVSLKPSPVTYYRCSKRQRLDTTPVNTIMQLAREVSFLILLKHHFFTSVSQLFQVVIRNAMFVHIDGIKVSIDDLPLPGHA
ncbi:hypothetical protein OH492_08690 [Vibrio chagasii]|nr:hypothetical protein [Vibrio chagasii]